MKFARIFIASIGLSFGCASTPTTGAETNVDATKIVEGEPSYVRGDIDRSAVRDVVMSHLNEVQLCGQYHELLRDSGAKGNVVVGFTIDKAGEVTVTRVAGSTMNNPEVEGCVAKAVTGWQFPSPQSETAEIAFPFSFKSDRAIKKSAEVSVEMTTSESYAQPVRVTPIRDVKPAPTNTSKISDKE